MKCFHYCVTVASLAVIAASAQGAFVTDGDFSAWDFGATGTATMTREASGGNPDARLNVTTDSGLTVYGTGVKTDFSTGLALAGAPFQLQLDVLSGSGAFGQGQRILLLVEQDSSVYGADLGVTGYPLYWNTLTFSGTFTDSLFPRLAGSGPTTPDFSGGTTTLFGFAAGNSNSGVLTQYYDNYRLDVTLSTVPVPGAFLLGGLGIGGAGWLRRRGTL
ncbi:MAG: hypothetical protein JW741_16180 [Sedimentisphaerales bacterium]|nr:hypothetical protein [Sedimentisphaerales bacterium]